MGRISHRQSRANRAAKVIRINTKAENVSPRYEYKGHVVDPGSCAPVRSHNRRHSLDFFRPSLAQYWEDSDGGAHSDRRSAVRASKPGWLPRLVRS